jgi:(1->4)-alpha-D-glucan 1-alpha-D-glucosylmutase
MTTPRVPASTYRIQFSLGFRFLDARDLIPYLHELGVTDLYASPRFRARRGSSHGYDVADPFRVNSELGTDREFEELVERLKRYRMGLLLDIVPNHMAASSDNPWWLDVMQNGPSSIYAPFFDIDWHPPITKATFLQENRILLPILGDLFGNVLENQELTLKLDESGFFVRYFDTKLPLDPKTYGGILEYSLKSLSAALGIKHPACQELSLLIEVVLLLPDRNSSDPGEIEKRRRVVGHLTHELWRLCQEYPEIKADLEKTLHVFNGTKGDPGSFHLLERLLADQVYRIAFWKLAAEEINYRRFFDVSDLVGLRVEEPGVFEARHTQMFQLIKEGKVTGLRVDHVDGLRDPLRYLQRLQEEARPRPKSKAGGRDLFLVVEKILAEDERLPGEWPVCGTTGYDFLNLVNGVFIDPAGLGTLRDSYRRFTGSQETFGEISYQSKKLVMEELFAGEVNILAHALGKLAAHDRRARDVPLSELRQALVEVIACLPVYRTYIRSVEVSEQDRKSVEQALHAASGRTPAGRVGRPAFAFLRSVLLLEAIGGEEQNKQRCLDFVMRWQQFTGAVMAKGVEDTALYLYHPLISLNEVGGNPGASGTNVEEFHRALQFRQKHMAYTLNASSTHDTKRSEDIRARINVLSEFPSQWARALRRWSKWNRVHKQTVSGRLAPGPNDEVLFYQTLVGAWPLHAEELPFLGDRLKEYMVKAVREAKARTNWLHPNAAYERAVSSFVDSLLRPSDDNRFLKDFLRLHKTLAPFGALNSLSQVLLKIASPGIPDFYQGTELWDFSLVDPDNRRPVDFKLRLKVLEDLRRRASANLPRLLAELLAHWHDGRIKFFVADRALDFRKAYPRLFLDGEYIPVEVRGRRRAHICAFARRLERQWCLVLVPRLVTKFTRPGRFPLGNEAWNGTQLILPRVAPKHWLDILTEETHAAAPRPRGHVLPLGKVLRSFPVALLASPLSQTRSLRL